MNADAALYRDAMRRINLYVAVLAVSGTVGSTILWGWPGAAGFAFGAAASWLNFRWIKPVVDSLGGEAEPRRAAGFAILIALRYLLLGAAGYVMLKVFGVNLLATVAGLLSVVAAVILEAVYQLFTYA